MEPSKGKGHASGSVSDTARTIRSMSVTSDSTVGGKESGVLPQRLRQGSSLSPVLYTAYMNGVAKVAN